MLHICARLATASWIPSGCAWSLRFSWRTYEVNRTNRESERIYLQMSFYIMSALLADQKVDIMSALLDRARKSVEPPSATLQHLWLRRQNPIKKLQSLFNPLNLSGRVGSWNDKHNQCQRCFVPARAKKIGLCVQLATTSKLPSGCSWQHYSSWRTYQIIRTNCK